MSLTQAVLSLARAKTQRDRIRILSAVAYDKRFNQDQQAELQSLLTEARKAPDDRVQALRPVLNPADVCKLVMPLAVGPKPILPESIDSTVTEWIEGWRSEARLRDQGHCPPGPLLIAGPTGVGKTMLAAFIAGELKDVRRAVVVDAHRLVESHMGETGRHIAEAFEAINLNSGLGVFEELDALAEVRKSGNDSATMENTRVSIALMRSIEASTSAIIATCNRPDALDGALLSRFEYRIDFPDTTKDLRGQVLRQSLGIDVELPDSLLRIDLRQAVGMCKRIKRIMILRGLSVGDAAAIVLGDSTAQKAA
jgi:SpoVK/Ycf46/Vps4 family AAA+-type ATPase